MFKIAKLKEVNNEKVKINYTTQEEYKYENGKSNLYDPYKTLSFNISGEDYSFSFDLNCKPEKLLEIPFSETIDFSKYIIQGETWLNIKDFNGIEPEVDIKITRYLKNKFAIYIKFYTALSDDDNDYSGVIEFSFDLDDYLNI